MRAGCGLSPSLVVGSSNPCSPLQVTGFQCFDYTPHADEGFRINVPSHALTIDTELSDEQKAKAAEAGLPESSVILVKVIGVNALSTIEAGDGDRTRLRIVRQVEVEED